MWQQDGKLRMRYKCGIPSEFDIKIQLSIAFIRLIIHVYSFLMKGNIVRFGIGNEILKHLYCPCHQICHAVRIISEIIYFHTIWKTFTMPNFVHTTLFYSSWQCEHHCDWSFLHSTSDKYFIFKVYVLLETLDISSVDNSKVAPKSSNNMKIWDVGSHLIFLSICRGIVLLQR